MSLSQKQHRNVCLIGFIVFSILPSICMKDFFAFNAGYSFVWLLYCYVVGGYLKRARDHVAAYQKIANIWSYLALSLVILGGNIFIYALFKKEIGYFNQYTSPITLVMAIVLLVCFSQIKINKIKQLLPALSAVAFDVYLIHCHILVYDHILCGSFIWVASTPALLIPIEIIGTAILAYSVFTLVGKLRMIVFKSVKINSFVRKIADKTDELFYKEFGAKK